MSTATLDTKTSELPADAPVLLAVSYLRVSTREQAERGGTLVVNRPASLRDCNEKFFATLFPELAPPTLVSRRADIIRDVFGGANPVHSALQRLKQEGRGVIVILRDGTAGVPMNSIPSLETSSEAARTRQWREVGLGAQILKDLGIKSIRLLSGAKFTYVGLAGFGIEITETETTES